ncbi:hypothetical protein I7I50_02595 [Histoplasma capsulatum G186AR]|uniref:Uncharacterized protein n=1 Tax=Ajellomyces capsulatus TaxID=5037 RepID=A0A8H7Z6A8_AJECA|nr:hypothetical protein I7I52_00740 [Histoplasma capsulatum]QSS71667.1 hypothetical protein I7I50_02595 [Histoplasma capsulatum G186AR]
MVKILLAAIAKFKMEYYVFDYTPTLTFLPEEPEFRTGTFLSDCEMHCNGSICTAFPGDGSEYRAIIMASIFCFG